MGLLGGVFPEVFEATGDLTAPRSDDGVGSAQAPKHARSLEALSDESAATGLDNAGADKISRDAEFGIAHQAGIFLEVTQVFTQ